jgi:hypothetical protein
MKVASGQFQFTKPLAPTVQYKLLWKSVKLLSMTPSERILRAVQFNAISDLRNRLGSERFIEWLITPCHMDGMPLVEAMESGLWQEVAELAEEAMSEGVDEI